MENPKDLQIIETAIAKLKTSDLTGEDSVIKKDDENVIQVASDLLVKKVDSSPLTAVKSFEELGLTDELKQGIYVGMGFQKPSRIQELALPLILQNPPQNLIGQAQTGTGKTAAFVLGMLSRVTDTKLPQALCINPTRELAKQNKKVTKKMAQFCKNISVGLVVKESQLSNEKTKVTDQILVGTPGMLLSVLGSRRCDSKQIKIIVIDEADNMIGQQGLSDQTKKILRLCNRSAQRLLFSATFPDDVENFAQSVAENPNVIQLKKEEAVVKQDVKEIYFDCKSQENKTPVLANIYPFLSVGQSIVFAQTKRAVKEVSKQMIKDGNAVSELHGDIPVEDRDSITKKFRNGETRVLITTDLLSRGIDIPQVSMIVNYDLPIDQYKENDYNTYVHRAGRTGRYDRKGLVINFVYDIASKENMKKFQEYQNKEIKEMDPDDFDGLEVLTAEL